MNKFHGQPSPSYSNAPTPQTIKGWKPCVGYRKGRLHTAEVSLYSPSRRHDLGCRAWRVCTSYCPTDTLSYIHLRSSRVTSRRRNVRPGYQDHISYRWPPYQPCLGIPCACIHEPRVNTPVETSTCRMGMMSATRSRRVWFLEGTSLSHRRYATPRSSVYPMANSRCCSCGSHPMPEDIGQKLDELFSRLGPLLILRCVADVSVAASNDDKPKVHRPVAFKEPYVKEGKMVVDEASTADLQSTCYSLSLLLSFIFRCSLRSIVCISNRDWELFPLRFCLYPARDSRIQPRYSDTVLVPAAGRIG